MYLLYKQNIVYFRGNISYLLDFSKILFKRALLHNMYVLLFCLCILNISMRIYHIGFYVFQSYFFAIIYNNSYNNSCYIWF